MKKLALYLMIFSVVSASSIAKADTYTPVDTNKYVLTVVNETTGSLTISYNNWNTGVDTVYTCTDKKYGSAILNINKGVCGGYGHGFDLQMSNGFKICEQGTSNCFDYPYSLSSINGLGEHYLICRTNDSSLSCGWATSL